MPIIPPTPASPLSLLADFVCMPVAMRGDRHLALIHDLHSRAAGGGAPAQALALAGRSEGPLPWEAPIYVVQDGIAYIEITGPLVKGYDDFTCWCYGMASTDRIQRTLSEIDSRADVSALVLLLNTPGGMAIGIAEVGDQLVDMGSRRLVVGFSSDTFASAGYWIAAGCTLIFATKSACVGSIGTYIALYDYTAMLEEWGIKLELFRQGKYKALGMPGKPLTKDERAFLDESTGRTNAAFTGFVSGRRPGVTSDTMQGQWFDGAQAAELGLVDRIVTGLPEVVREIMAAKSGQ